MSPPAAGESFKVITADTLARLPALPDACVDAVVCDPPYGIDFNNQKWDGSDIRKVGRGGRRRTGISPGQAFQNWTRVWAAELCRVLKPGGHLVAFGAPRMVHRLTSGLEDGGLEIRDMLLWMFGTGMPKSRRMPGGTGTALKPFYEPIVLARRPLDGTVADTLARHGTGVLNTEACAIADGGRHRWPANVLLSHDQACRPGRCTPGCAVGALARQHTQAPRFLYRAKASRRERDAGCEQLPLTERELFVDHRRPAGAPRPRMRNLHPTVKPIAVMTWLVELITPPGGLVLDPFCGSGTTGIAAALTQRRFIGMERDPGHAELARTRIAHWAANNPPADQPPDPEPATARPSKAGRPRRRPA
jgi:site-specific DNA-methyltransferase (adenine-specific)